MCVLEEFILKKKFPFELSDNLLSLNDLSRLCLEIVIDNIDSTKIFYGSKELKELFDDIDEKCKGKHLWALLGKENDDAKKWLPLQLASVSSKDVIKEIKADFKRMIPFDPNIDTKNLSSYFYKNIMEVEIGKDNICQKYSKLKERIPLFAIAIYNEDCTKKGTYTEKDTYITKYQIKEIDLAKEIKPLIWNASPMEKKYINDNNLSME